jgi:hypothetical protein
MQKVAKELLASVQSGRKHLVPVDIKHSNQWNIKCPFELNYFLNAREQILLKQVRNSNRWTILIQWNSWEHQCKAK